MQSNESKESRLYRPCVGIAVFNQQGKVFVGERIDTPGAWQMPQGGIDEDEDLKTAALRELHEETSIKSIEVLKILDKPLRYDLPDELRNHLWKGRYAGQEQYWIAARFLGQDSEIDIHHHPAPEFSDWRWVPIEETPALIVSFKRPIYEQLIHEFREFTKLS